MRSTPTAVTQAFRLAFRLKPIRSVQTHEGIVGLTTDAQPDTLIGSERDKFQAVPEIVGVAQVALVYCTLVH